MFTDSVKGLDQIIRLVNDIIQ